MRCSYVTRITLVDFVERLDREFGRPGRLYLVGETTQVFEGWRPWTPRIEFTADVASEDRSAFSRVARGLAEELGVSAIDEWPGDVIPLPEGYEGRARPAAAGASSSEGAIAAGAVPRHLALYHFDPYSVAFRFIARGDEPDYHLVLTYLEHGWMTVEEMKERLAALLPSLTAETIQQDPAEFRRKYKGLLQMWEAVQPRTTHRSTPV
jgi:hypothetical protein